MHDSALELTLRHPDVAKLLPIKSWVERSAVVAFADAHEADATRVIVSGPGMTVADVRISKATEGSVAAFELRLVTLDESRARDALVKFAGPGAASWALRPDLVQRGEVFVLGWSAVSPTFDTRYTIDADVGAAAVVRSEAMSCGPFTPGVPGDCWLGEDDAHHVHQFKDLVDRWLEGASDNPYDRAFRIFQELEHIVRHDDYPQEVRTLTWNDVNFYSSACLGMRGACDEMAVLLATLWRAAGIPARVRMLTFNKGDTIAAHMFAECFVDENYGGSTNRPCSAVSGRWVHGDVAMQAFDHPSLYRYHKMRNIAVSTMSDAWDATASVPFHGVSDVEEDGVLHPWCDWRFSVAYPGALEKSYSVAGESKISASSAPKCKP